MDLHPDMQPTFIGVSCLPAIEMEVVLTVVNQAGAEHGWRPGLLLVQGWPLFCTKAALRSVTEMNAKPNRKRSSIVLLSGLTLHDLEGARGAAEAVGAEARQLFLGDSTAMLLTGLSAETMGTLFAAAGAFGPDLLEPIERQALLLAQVWPFMSMYLSLNRVSRRAAAAERAARGEEPDWPMIDGSLVAASWADFAAGRFTVPPPRPDIITGELSSTGDRICMAWGLSTEQIDAALVACDDLGADVSVHAGLSGPAQLFTLTETGALVPCEKP